MSRRLRRPQVQALIDQTERTVQQRRPRSGLRYIDAKPLPIGNASGDREAKAGYAAGGIAKGYKLHVIYDSTGVLDAWRLEAMAPREAAVAPHLIAQLQGSGTLVGDNAYDLNRLYDLAGQRGWQLVAPRRRGTRLGKIRHSSWRIRAHRQMSRDQRRALYRRRAQIERFFGHLGNSPGGLGPLPNWVRTYRRVRLWVQAKLILYQLRYLKPPA